MAAAAGAGDPRSAAADTLDWTASAGAKSGPQVSAAAERPEAYVREMARGELEA